MSVSVLCAVCPDGNEWEPEKKLGRYHGVNPSKEPEATSSRKRILPQTTLSADTVTRMSIAAASVYAAG